ncbi:Maf family protein [Chengkuizengella axinellae]|uniref:dTTP/UTP pyrophosphatase n=1 Tax=Chengkuizengella axinellae TaxID=3064388 RepID=A0ABT9ITP7_9BACL|nr:Maf family protein [Chengkuizengella sp. 2205SS18-9]MDP5272725.1 Maf family protein [Chengkuizengella sp. 2205SS18-9]
MLNKTNLILASSSPRRQELIRSLNLPYTICVSDVDETLTEIVTPAEMVKVLSAKKAVAVYDKIRSEQKDGIVIGADTIVVKDGKILGKPKDKNDAISKLQHLQGAAHEVFSGIACIDLTTGKKIVKSQTTIVHMKSLQTDQIERYVNTGEPMDKAGAYAIQGLGATMVDSIEGSYTNVVGLSLSLLSDMLLEFGIEVI